MQSRAVRPFKLTEADRRTLCNFAELRRDRAPDGADPTPAEAMLRRVSGVLSLWPGLEEELDHAPTPKQCAAALRPVEGHAEALRLALEALDSRSRGFLPASLDLGRLRSELLTLRGCAGRAVQRLEGQPTPGTPPPRALCFLVYQLAAVFEEFHPEHGKAAQDDLAAFVGVALQAGGIPFRDADFDECLTSRDKGKRLLAERRGERAPGPALARSGG